MPGAVAGLLLSDYGAQVVKLERPGGGPDLQSITRKAWDRGKWSVECDLSQAAGREAALDLLERADIFLESFGAAGSPEGELDYEQIKDRFPRLIHCAITGYGCEGPLRDRPGYDALVAARFGLMAEQQGHREGPIFLGHPVVGYCTGFLATIGILSSVRARWETGRGQRVDTSLLDGMLSVMSMNWWWNEKGLSYLAREGTETGFGRNRLITDPFVCQDGEWLMMHTGGDGAFKRTMDILGLGDQVRTIDGLEMSVPLDDGEYHAARHLAPDVFKTRPRSEWLERFYAADIAALPLLHPNEVFNDDQVRFADVVIEQPDDQYGAIRQVGPAIRFSESPPDRPGPAPRLGEHADRLAEVVSRFAGSPGSVPAAGSPISNALEGIRILDLSSFFATAYGARLLSDLGADVIKVEPLSGDQMRPLADLFEGAQRGKRNLAVDLRSEEGRQIVLKLAATCDVVMHNFRPGKAEKAGIGYEDLRAVNPNLVYCYLPGFGSSGPKSELKSFAPLVSGFVGLLYEAAGEGNPPVRRAIGNEDLYNGFVGAIAVLLGLQHRAATGQGQYIENPQLHSSLFVITEQCTDADGQPLPGLQMDSEQMGYDPLYRLYRTSDGWICVAAVGQSAFERLCAALQITPDESISRQEGRASDPAAVVALLSERFAALTSQEAFDALEANRVPCEIPLDYPYLPEFLWEEWALDSERVFEHHHPEHGWVREVGLVVRLSETPGLHKGTSVRLGYNTVEILEELGYEPEQISALLERVCVSPAAPEP
jgi:crotonobetainyl-CoA:carnitine CoA-transferase CaiB-like acyl-CoA transferase